jgi:hypothetical protein
MLRTFQKKAK